MRWVGCPPVHRIGGGPGDGRPGRPHFSTSIKLMPSSGMWLFDLDRGGRGLMVVS